MSRSAALVGNNNAATTQQTQGSQQNNQSGDNNDGGSSLAGDAESAESDSLKLHPGSGAAAAAMIKQPLTMVLSTATCMMVAIMVGYPF